MVCVPKAPAPLPWGHGQDLMGPVSPTRKEGPGVCAPPQAGAFHVSSHVFPGPTAPSPPHPGVRDHPSFCCTLLPSIPWPLPETS